MRKFGIAASLTRCMRAPTRIAKAVDDGDGYWSFLYEGGQSDAPEERPDERAQVFDTRKVALPDATT